ncbi:unnamed protein product [Parajaminaea phylloscopi]
MDQPAHAPSPSPSPTDSGLLPLFLHHPAQQPIQSSGSGDVPLWLPLPQTDQLVAEGVAAPPSPPALILTGIAEDQEQLIPSSVLTAQSTLPSERYRERYEEELRSLAEACGPLTPSAPRHTGPQLARRHTPTPTQHEVETPKLSTMRLGRSAGDADGQTDDQSQPWSTAPIPDAADTPRAAVGLGWPSQTPVPHQHTSWQHGDSYPQPGHSQASHEEDDGRGTPPPLWISLLGKTAPARSATYDMGMSSRASFRWPGDWRSGDPTSADPQIPFRALRHAVSTSEGLQRLRDSAYHRLPDGDKFAVRPSAVAFPCDAHSSLPCNTHCGHVSMEMSLHPAGLSGTNNAEQWSAAGSVDASRSSALSNSSSSPSSSDDTMVESRSDDEGDDDDDSFEPETVSPLQEEIRLPLKLPPPDLHVLSSPYTDMRRHLIRHGMRSEADVYADLPPDYALHGYMTAIPGGPPALLQQSSLLLRQHHLEVARQMARSGLPPTSGRPGDVHAAEQTLPEALYFDFDSLNQQAVADSTLPTHVLAVHSSVVSPGQRPAGMLIPIHSLPYILQCVSLTALPATDIARAATAGTLEVPIVSILVPRPKDFPLTHRFIYNRDTMALLTDLLPVQAIDRLLVSRAPHLARALDEGQEGSSNDLLESCVDLLSQGTTESDLLEYLAKVHACWANGVAIGLAPSIYWDTLSKAWDFLISALQVQRRRRGASG